MTRKTWWLGLGLAAVIGCGDQNKGESPNNTVPEIKNAPVDGEYKGKSPADTEKKEGYPAPDKGKATDADKDKASDADKDKASDADKDKAADADKGKAADADKDKTDDAAKPADDAKDKKDDAGKKDDTPKSV